MQDKLNQAVNDAEASGDDPTILRSDTVAVQRLENEYRLTLNDYTQNDLLGDSPHDVQLLNSAHTHLPIQAQRSLAQNALGSWQTYQSAINTVLGDLQSGDLIGARVALAGAVERAHTDSSGILRPLQDSSQTLAEAVASASAALGKSGLMLTLVEALLIFVLAAVTGGASEGEQQAGVYVG